MTEATENKAKLFKKMAAVMGELKTFRKDATNEFHKYDYVSASAVLEIIGRAMAKHGIAFFPSVVGIERTDDRRYIVEYEYIFACSETGAIQVSRWFSEGLHTTSNNKIDEKALNKIATTAQKYFLMSTFVISSGDESEIDQQENPPVHWSQTELGRDQIAAMKDKALNTYGWTEEQLKQAAMTLKLAEHVNLASYGAALKAAHAELFPEPESATIAADDDTYTIEVATIETKVDISGRVYHQLGDIFVQVGVLDDLLDEDMQVVIRSIGDYKIGKKKDDVLIVEYDELDGEKIPLKITRKLTGEVVTVNELKAEAS